MGRIMALMKKHIALTAAGTVLGLMMPMLFGVVLFTSMTAVMTNTTTAADDDDCPQEQSATYSGASEATADPALVAKLKGNKNAAILVQALEGKLDGIDMHGLTFTPLMIAGIMGNAEAESGFNPNADNGIGFRGMLQWGGGRLKALEAKPNPWTVKTQAQFLLDELAANVRPGTYESMQKATDPSDAALRWGIWFEGGYCGDNTPAGMKYNCLANDHIRDLWAQSPYAHVGIGGATPNGMQGGKTRITAAESAYQMLGGSNDGGSAKPSAYVGMGAVTVRPAVAVIPYGSAAAKAIPIADTSNQVQSRGDASAFVPSIKKELDWAVGIANDSKHGYSQDNRNKGTDYDCSSLVWNALKQGGFDVGGQPFATSDKADIPERATLKKSGFKLVSGADFKTGKGLQPGDVLWRNGHTGLYLGDGKTVAAHWDEQHDIHGHQPGDQTGDEISVVSLDYGKPYTEAYRYDGAMTDTDYKYGGATDSAAAPTGVACDTTDGDPTATPGSDGTVVYGDTSKAGSAPTNTNNYGWLCSAANVCKSGDGGKFDDASADYRGYGYQCVWYAWVRLHVLHGTGWTYILGNGGDIWKNAQATKGWTVDRSPHPGDGISGHGQPFAHKTHVAVVEKVEKTDDGNWRILISEGNHDGRHDWVGYNTRWLTKSEALAGDNHFFRYNGWNN